MTGRKEMRFSSLEEMLKNVSKLIAFVPSILLRAAFFFDASLKYEALILTLRSKWCRKETQIYSLNIISSDLADSVSISRRVGLPP